MSEPIRTRFAPSPTGYLHVGGARTALFNWLFARKHGGTFVLRVEDTDQARNTEAAREAIFEGMSWLGLDWDEGHGVGGQYGPYFQSEREAQYLTWFEKLREAGRVYEDDGAWRFRFERKPITVHDLVCGEVTIDYTDESNTPDMVVRRSDGSFVFHFVNVVDDLEMKISHVIRGEDHLMNTPKHLQLFEALGVAPPKYAHLPLILNEDGSKMSKRDKGAAVHEYPEQGFLSSAVVNFTALLGWSPKDDDEIFSPSDLVERFSLENVNRSPARFDWKKCRWVNQQHLLKLAPQDFVAAVEPYTKEAGIPTDGNFTEMVTSVQEKVETLTEVPGAIAFYLNDELTFESEPLAKVSSNPDAPALLTDLLSAWSNLEDWSEAKAAIGTVAKAAGKKPGQLMFPVRIALSGKAGGPDLEAILRILGKDSCVTRLQKLITLLPTA